MNDIIKTEWNGPLETELTRLKNIEKLYFELIYEVASKFPNETRHETVLRYIKERENNFMLSPDKNVNAPKCECLSEGCNPNSTLISGQEFRRLQNLEYGLDENGMSFERDYDE